MSNDGWVDRGILVFLFSNQKSSVFVFLSLSTRYFSLQSRLWITHRHTLFRTDAAHPHRHTHVETFMITRKSNRLYKNEKKREREKKELGFDREPQTLTHGDDLFSLFLAVGMLAAGKRSLKTLWNSKLLFNYKRIIRSSYNPMAWKKSCGPSSFTDSLDREKIHVVLKKKEAQVKQVACLCGSTGKQTETRAPMQSARTTLAPSRPPSSGLFGPR